MLKRIALLAIVSFAAFGQEVPDAGMPAVAAPAPVAAPSMLQTALQHITLENVVSVMLLVLGSLGGAGALSARRKEQIAIITDAAFHGVENLAGTTATPIDDKAAAGLKIANEWMLAHGWRKLRPDEEELVKLGFKSLNGETKVQEKIQAKEGA